MRVTRTLHVESPTRGYAVILGASCDGPGLRRRETLGHECDGRDDLPFTPRERISEDNGRMWTATGTRSRCRSRTIMVGGIV